MEEMTRAIERFLTLDYGCGWGDGSGYGSCDGWGYGRGDGSGYGRGDGSGYGRGDGSGYGRGDGSGCGWGDGSGYGSGDGLKSFNKNKVYYIDSVPTVLEKVHLNLAKGYTINADLTTNECYVAKGNNLFAHGATPSDAIKALQDKIFENMDDEEKIDTFVAEFNLYDKYPAKTFYEWHHKLTGSCEFGRNSFIKNHGIDLENGMYSVKEFIEKTRNDFGGDIIRQLEKKYESEGE